MRFTVIILISLLFSMGCGAAIQLTAAGSQVQVTSLEDEDCEFLQTFTKQEGANFRSFSENHQRAEISIRNEAAVIGATHVIISAPQATNSTPWSFSEGSCNNCLILVGRAYRCN